MRHYKGNLHHRGSELAQGVNEHLILSLRDISHTMRALYEGKGSQKRVLMLLREAGSITQRELTARLGIQSGSASEVIAKLEGAGLLTRTLSEADRRTADVSLTEEGRRQADEALEQRRQRHEEMFSVLTLEEKMQLLSLVEKIDEDWENRYQGGRGHCHHHHSHGHDCAHNCDTCMHPCGRSGRA